MAESLNNMIMRSTKSPNGFIRIVSQRLKLLYNKIYILAFHHVSRP